MNEPDEGIEELYWGGSAGERTLWLALGYAEAAAVLARSLAKDEFTRQFRSTRVVLQVAHHAIELYLKGAIALKQGHLPRATHDLAELRAQYDCLFPGAEFDLDIPFELVAESPTLELFPNAPRGSAEVPLSLRYRYANARDGAPIRERDAYRPEEWAHRLEVLAGRFTILFFAIRRSVGLE